MKWTAGDVSPGLVQEAPANSDDLTLEIAVVMKVRAVETRRLALVVKEIDQDQDHDLVPGLKNSEIYSCVSMMMN